jgi:YHS domain-containing protein
VYALAFFEGARRAALILALFWISAAAAAGGSITLAWDPDPDAVNVQGYMVFYGTNSAQPELSVDAGAVTAVTITNLNPGQTYYFSVAAYDTNDVIGPPSAELSYSVPGDSTSVPGNVTLLPGAAPGSATLAWNPVPDPTVAGYLVYYGTMSGMPAFSVDAGAAASVTITNLSPGQTYYFSVAAYDTNDMIGPSSGELSYVVPGSGYFPPGSVAVTPGVVPGSAILAWNTVSNFNVQGYMVYYGTNAAQPEQSTNVGTGTLATISNLAPGQTYYFSVAAYDTNDVVGPPSGELSYAVPGYGYFPSGSVAVTAAGLPGSVILAWNAVTNITVQGYMIFYGTNAAQPELSTNVGASTLATISNLVPGLTYYFSVAAYDTNDVVGPPSTEFSYVVPQYAYFPPGSVAVTAGAVPGSAILDWNAVTNVNVQGYMVFYGTNAAQPELSMDAGAATTVAISNLNPGLTYYFAVAAYDTNDVVGPPSAELSYIVPGYIQFAPGGVTIAPGSVPGSTTLTWNPVPDPAVQGYLVYYGTTNGMPMFNIDAGAATSVTISNLNPWLACYFSVAAYDTNDVTGPPSTGLAYTVPGSVMLTPGASPGDPVNIGFQIAPACWFEVQASADLNEWDTIWITSVYQFSGWAIVSDFDSPNFPQRFYRILSHQGQPPDY